MFPTTFESFVSTLQIWTTQVDRFHRNPSALRPWMMQKACKLTSAEP